MESLKIEKLIPGGQGLATLPTGKKIFLWNALPEEEITNYSIISQKSHFVNATATEIATPSPHRIEPRDACYLSTSPWQIMDYAYELAQKSTLVTEMFRQEGIDTLSSENIEMLFERDFAICDDRCDKDGRRPRNDGNDSFRARANSISILTDNNEFHYRNKMEYSLYWDNDTEQISLAFHARNSHRKIPVTHSSIERPEIWQRATEIIADLNARHEPARKYQSLLLRCNQQGIVGGGLYENGKPHPTFPNLTDTILGHQYSYSPNGFFQINLPVYEMALRDIAKHINTDEVLDLYAGVGTIGLSVARNRKLTLVECDKYAYAELERNCQNGPLAILANSEDALDFINSNQTVIVDPPRAGCHTKLLAKLLDTLPPTIIYLSCNPITQARDIKILAAESKYRINHAQPFNFFPRTPHIENLIVLTRV